MFHPIANLSKYEKSLDKSHLRLPALSKARETKCPMNKTHVKLRMLPSDCSPKDRRTITYEGLSEFLEINSQIDTGLDSFQDWSKKLWRRKVLQSEFVTSENLRPELLREKILDIEGKELDLRNYLVGFHLSHLIYGSIHFNKSLRSVNIADNNLTSNAVEPITIALHNNVYVQSFDISSNYLLPKGAILLGSMLHRNRHLTMLNVSNCRLTDFGKNFDGVLKLRVGLEGHPTLRSLNVSSNMLGSRGVLILCALLCENYSINEIDFSKNNYVEAKKKPLLKLLDKAAASTLLIRSRMTGVLPNGRLTLIFKENIEDLDLDAIQEAADKIYAARVKRMLDIEAFFEGRFRIPKKTKEPSPEKPPDSEAWKIMNKLPRHLRKRVHEKLVGTVECVLPSFDDGVKKEWN